MLTLIIIFTLVGFNFSIWTIMGFFRYVLEKTGLSRLEKKYPPHSATRWLLVLLSLLRLDIILGFGLRAVKAGRNKLNEYLHDKTLAPDFAAKFKLSSYDAYFDRLADRNNPDRIGILDVAAIIPAHNEELTIAQTIKKLKTVMPARNIFVGSDASTDRTVTVARDLGCRVADIRPNRGKANVLVYLIEHFKLAENYRAVIIVDADSEIDDHYLARALPLFDDPDVIAVAAHAMSKWQRHLRPRLTMLFAAYRVRLYRVIQTVMRYGQTWKYTNVTSIIPGFASIYRTSVLDRIKINASGLIIEDYNMTFEVHHKKLGKIAYDPGIIGVSQDPMNFRDYYKQVKRWNLGFWQTLKRHGFWPSLFSLAVGMFVLEMSAFAVFMLILPLLLAWFALNSFGPLPLPFAIPVLGFHQLRFIDLAIGVFLIDYLLTVVVAIYESKPMLIVYGLAFPLLRFLDAWLFLYTLPLAFTVKTEGRWISPQRQIFAET